MEFDDKVAVVTGGGSGIGRSMAMAFARQGANIVIADIDNQRMTDVCNEIAGLGQRAIGAYCDVSKDADVENLTRQALSAFGKTDILMNNAGVMVRGYPDKITMADWEWQMNINLLGIVRGVRAFLPHMLERGSGYILNTSSAVGLTGSPFSSGTAYSTSKFAVTGFSEALYKYLRPKGIMVSVVCPGMVRTNITKVFRYSEDDEEKRRALKLEVDRMFAGPNVMEPDDFTQIVIKAMKEKRFLIVPNVEGTRDMLKRRAENLQGYLDWQIEVQQNL